MNNAVHALVEEVNSQGTPVYQEETERESSTLLLEGKTNKKIIYNLITNPIIKEKLLEILKEI